MTINVVGLHHHAVRVPADPVSAELTRRFYGDVMGLEIDSSHPDVPGATAHWFNAGAHAQLHLIPGRGDKPVNAGYIDPSAPHVSFAVTDIRQARAELDRLELDYRIRRSPVGATRDRLFLHDPAGNLIELHQADACRCTAAARTRQTSSYTRVWSTVMFADMRGFTAVSEQLPPAEVVPLLNEYFALLTRITIDHGGTIFHLAGDGLMAGFGVPEARADDSQRAVDTAREMLAGFGDLAGAWKQRLGIDTGLGIGVNAGEVIAGNVGSASHASYTIIGDTVNVASRLSQRARAGEALFSSTVRKALQNGGTGVTLLELPAMQLRGRVSPVEIFCIPAPERLDLRPAMIV